MSDIKTALGLHLLYSIFLNLRRRAAETLNYFRWSKMGLNDLDNLLEPYLGSIRNGVFIEVGANDGVSQSNTYYLEKALNWRGILIEPIPELFRKCKRNRKQSIVINCALTSPTEAGNTLYLQKTGHRFLMSKVVPDCDDLSGINFVPVDSNTLTNVILNTPFKEIDFFSLDVEGYELNVLSGLDLVQFQPTYILVETAQVNKVTTALGKYYTKIAQLTFHDYLYKRKADYT